MKIAHLSDIHYSKSWMFREYLLIKYIDMANEENPDVVIITGDLTDYGLKKEFEGVKKFLEQLKYPYLIVPGNHDARHEGYKKFEEIFPNGRFFTKQIEGYLFIGLDSSEPDIDEGHIGREQLKWLIEKLSSGKRAIIFLHHHLVPIPNKRTAMEQSFNIVDINEEIAITKINLLDGKRKKYVWRKK